MNRSPSFTTSLTINTNTNTHNHDPNTDEYEMIDSPASVASLESTTSTQYSFSLVDHQHSTHTDSDDDSSTVDLDEDDVFPCSLNCSVPATPTSSPALIKTNSDQINFNLDNNNPLVDASLDYKFAAVEDKEHDSYVDKLSDSASTGDELYDDSDDDHGDYADSIASMFEDQTTCLNGHITTRSVRSTVLPNRPKKGSVAQHANILPLNIVVKDANNNVVSNEEAQRIRRQYAQDPTFRHQCKENNTFNLHSHSPVPYKPHQAGKKKPNQRKYAVKPKSKQMNIKQERQTKNKQQNRD